MTNADRTKVVHVYGGKWPKPASAPSTEAPGHTDLMVSPESIDAFLEKNPPTEAGVEEPEVERFDPNDHGVMIRNEVDGDWIKLSDHNTIVERAVGYWKAAENEKAELMVAVNEAEADLATERERSARLREDVLDEAIKIADYGRQRAHRDFRDRKKAEGAHDMAVEITAALRELKGGE